MLKEFSFQTRKQNIQKLKTKKFDLVIIGGGINGAGAARDAASRGMSVALVEMQDYAEGTSSRSSKLIHGGIRYLENLEFDLVFEALSERSKLFKIAPHLVHPLRFVLPVFKKSRVGFFKLGLGMWAYDALSLFRTPELHERLSARETLKRLPILQDQGLKGSYVYSDAYMDDDRLVLETLRSANALGSVCVNHVKATRAHFEATQVSAIGCKDELSGEEFVIQGKHFISTVGPWTDELGHNFFNQWSDIMRPSKGIHLTFSRDRVPLDQAIVMGVEDRIVFGIPRKNMVIIGTTDTDYKGSLKDVCSTREDVDYLLSVANDYFPGARLTHKDIIASYAGVRPLVSDGSESEGKTSREHVIISDSRNITFVAGGKYTTYRHMAKQAIDQALNQFPIEDLLNIKKSDTDKPLSKYVSEDKLSLAQRSTARWSKKFQLSKNVVEHFVDRYGYEALEIMNLYSQRVTSYTTDQEKIWALEAFQSIHHTMCINLVDFYIRRTPLMLAYKNHGFAFKELLLKIFKKELGWSEEQVIEQWGAVEHHIKHEMGWKSN